jgi:hypothetical protein
MLDKSGSIGYNIDVAEVRIKDARTGGEKGEKPEMLGFVDPNALLDVARVAGFGAKKYAKFNYTKGFDWSLSYNALLRHVLQFLAGEDIDPESGLPHLAHAAWQCLCLLTFWRFKRGTDDRFPLGPDQRLGVPPPEFTTKPHEINFVLNLDGPPRPFATVKYAYNLALKEGAAEEVIEELNRELQAAFEEELKSAG